MSDRCRIWKHDALLIRDLFRLDITQHMSLCRHYVRELRRSVLLETPEPENAFGNESAESLDNNIAGPSGCRNGDTGLEDTPQRLSAFLRSEGRTSIHSNGSSRSDHSAHNGPDIIAGANFGVRLPDPDSPGHTVTREDIRASAVRILYTFLLPGSEREVQLPEQMRNEIICMIEDEGRDDPEVFDDPKDFVFQAMERDAFPRFLQAKVFGNLVQQSITVRLVMAGASLLGAFWAAWYGILSDQPRNVRCWVSHGSSFFSVDFPHSNKSRPFRSFYRLPSVATSSARTSTRPILSWRSLDSANTTP